jgi:hypothetical protein
LYDLE